MHDYVLGSGRMVREGQGVEVHARAATQQNENIYSAADITAKCAAKAAALAAAAAEGAAAGNLGGDVGGDASSVVECGVMLDSHDDGEIGGRKRKAGPARGRGRGVKRQEVSFSAAASVASKSEVAGSAASPHSAPDSVIDGVSPMKLVDTKNMANADKWIQKLSDLGAILAGEATSIGQDIYQAQRVQKSLVAKDGAITNKAL